MWCVVWGEGVVGSARVGKVCASKAGSRQVRCSCTCAEVRTSNKLEVV